EEAHRVTVQLEKELYPDIVRPRIFVSHTRPEVLLGVLEPLHTGYETTRALGFINHGGTLNVHGMFFVNRCSWCHILLEVAQVLGLSRDELLLDAELAVMDGTVSPEGVVWGDTTV
ncbi:MAG: xylulose 5-phosphate 3-epimerase, partial [Syntrophorhabdus sp.]